MCSQMADQSSLDKLNILHPEVRQSAIDAYNESCRITPVGVHPSITETYRSFERSDALYAQGRTTKGEIVTNAKGGQSIHNYYLALDFVILLNGKMNWNVDANWMKVVSVFKKHGWEWGGDWKSIKDYPHFQKTNGLSLKQIQAKYKKNDFIPGTKYINLDGSVPKTSEA
jgi:peptidoglycan L-alanyl-D-glutamate endopeptidase CwlK